jgi:hypothetical protein
MIEVDLCMDRIEVTFLALCHKCAHTHANACILSTYVGTYLGTYVFKVYIPTTSNTWQGVGYTVHTNVCVKQL